MRRFPAPDRSMRRFPVTDRFMCWFSVTDRSMRRFPVSDSCIFTFPIDHFRTIFYIYSRTLHIIKVLSFVVTDRVHTQEDYYLLIFLLNLLPAIPIISHSRHPRIVHIRIVLITFAVTLWRDDAAPIAALGCGGVWDSSLLLLCWLRDWGWYGI